MDVLKESRGLEYFNNLHSLIGLSPDRWQEVIIKELLDNSLDAIDGLDSKEIHITCMESLFSICDSAGGIPENVLDNIYDFNLYVSSKRHVRMVSRGCQGNALKSIIALCFKENVNLYFVTDGKKITYTPDATKIGLGHLEGAFAKIIEQTDQKPGVYVEVSIDMWFLAQHLFPCWKVNPDVKIFVNGEEYRKYSETKNFTRDHSIHWYDLQAFSELLKRTAINFPEKTTKQFISQFSGTQRIISKLNVPGKSLSDFYTDDSAIEDLFDRLRENVSKFRPQILEKFTIGKTTAAEMYEERFVGYRKAVGEYESNGADIPYLIEVILSKTDDEGSNIVTTCINNSKNYSDIPFRFNLSDCTLAGQEHSVNELSRLLYQVGFMSGSGHELFIHLVTPHLEFYDKAKSTINSNNFIGDLIHVIDPLLAPVIKAIRKEHREQRAADKPVHTSPKCKAPSKKSLMFRYFKDGAQLSTGDWRYKTTARMVFYSIRRIISNNHDIVLSSRSDFSTFTQTVITRMFEKEPELEEWIHFERRGFYYDQETGEEIPMSTQQVNDFSNELRSRDKCRVILSNGEFIPSHQEIEFPYELAVGSVLFIEKQGFTEVFKKSGILDELNLGLISSQGFGTRAIKKMMQEFISRGIKVYALTDCDLAGQVIASRLTGGSSTFKDKLDVNLIGLTYADVKALDKTRDAEEYTTTKSYVNILERLTQEEKDFFLKKTHRRHWDGEKASYTYRRVELNALTMPEFLDFIRAKIPRVQLRPSAEQIKEMVRIDVDALKRDAVTQHLLSQVDKHMEMLAGIDININADDISVEIDHAMNNGRSGERWQHVLSSIIQGRQHRIMNVLKDKLSL